MTKSGESHRFTLAFLDPGLEFEFQLDDAPRAVRVLRSGLLSTASMMGTVMLLVLWMDPAHLVPLLGGSFLIALILTTFALTYRVKTSAGLQRLSVVPTIFGGVTVLYLGTAPGLAHAVPAGLTIIGILAFHRLGFATAVFVFGFVLLLYAADLVLVRTELWSLRLIDGAMTFFAAVVLAPMARAVESARRDAFFQRRRSEALLLNVLPASIAARLKAGDSLADGFGAVSVLFSDLVGFTALSSRMTPADLVAMLDELFSRFDDLAERHGVEKIKTIGDAYMVAGGIPTPRADHARAVAAMAVDMLVEVRDLAARTGLPLELRVGVHSGPVVAGVIGKKRCAYDLWGDTVNVASRMESQGVGGRVHVTAETRALLGDAYRYEDRGMIEIKGKGCLQTFLLQP